MKLRIAKKIKNSIGEDRSIRVSTWRKAVKRLNKHNPDWIMDVFTKKFGWLVMK